MTCSCDSHEPPTMGSPCGRNRSGFLAWRPSSRVPSPSPSTPGRPPTSSSCSGRSTAGSTVTNPGRCLPDQVDPTAAHSALLLDLLCEGRPLDRGQGVPLQALQHGPGSERLKESEEDTTMATIRCGPGVGLRPPAWARSELDEGEPNGRLRVRAGWHRPHRHHRPEPGPHHRHHSGRRPARDRAGRPGVEGTTAAGGGIFRKE